MYSKIGALTKPKTNLQILQRNVLLKFKSLYTFLQKHHPQLAAETRTCAESVCVSVCGRISPRAPEAATIRLELETRVGAKE